MRGWRRKATKPQIFQVYGRKFKIRPLPAAWWPRFYLEVIERRSAQLREFSALASGGLSASVSREDNDSLLRGVATICAARDQPHAVDPQACIATWGARLENELTRAALVQILDAQISCELPFREIEQAAAWAVELAAQHGQTIKADL